MSISTYLYLPTSVVAIAGTKVDVPCHVSLEQVLDVHFQMRL